MGTKHLFLIILMLLSAIAFACPSYSIGLSSDILPKYILAEPGSTYSFTFIADGYGSDTDPYVKGDLAGYVSLSEPRLIAPFRKEFIATVSFPDAIDASPGMHTVLIGAAELSGSQESGISVRTRVQTPLNIFVLYPYKYITAVFRTQNVNAGETADFYVDVSNMGVPFLSLVRVSIDILDSNSTKLREISSGYFSLASGEGKSIKLELDTEDLASGRYSAFASITYDDEILILNQSFRIGQMKVRVANYTRHIYSGRISPFEIIVENEYNGAIPGVFAEIAIDTPSGEITAKTTSESMEPLSKKAIIGYVDAEDIEPGEYNLTISVYYENDKSVERGTVYAVKPPMLMAPGNLWLAAGIAAAALIVILTLLNIALLLKRRR